MLSKKEKELFDEVIQKTNGYVGLDQYGDGHSELYIKSVDNNYQKITLTNGRQYLLSPKHSPEDTLSDLNEIVWFPHEQRGDWDVIKLANYGEWNFIHGS